MRFPLRHPGSLSLLLARAVRAAASAAARAAAPAGGAALAALCVLAPSDAHAAAMVPPVDSRPKDFAFVKKDGVYHLFYIRHNDFLPPFATEVDFGHAVSTDLYHWRQLTPVLGLDPYGWDNAHVWAPSIVQSGGLYWMFYTGISEVPGEFAATQRIGVAVSSDLMTWNRVYGQPVWQSSGAPWAWWAPLDAAMACRDPFVMEDPGAPGQYLLYYTATPASDTVSTLVGVARSPAGDLSEWVDEKPLWITHRSFTFNVLTESPHLFEHNGRWFLFITTNAGQPLTFFVTSNPLGEPAEWTYRGRLRNMLGVDTSTWFASEELRDGEVDLFAYVNGDRIELRQIVWGTGDDFTLAEPALFHVQSMTWTRRSVREGDPVGLTLVVANPFAFAQSLEAFVLGADGREIPAPLDSLGLDPRPSLAGDTTTVRWFARRWPSGLDPATPMRLRVALDDGTASTPWLTVAADPRASGDPVPQRDTVPDAPVPPDTLATATPGGPAGASSPGALRVRALDRTPLGAGPAVAFELARDTDVRADVFDLQGRRLATLAERRFAAGTQVLAWDGRLAGGARAARGLYFVRIATPEGVRGVRVLLAR